MTTAQQRRALGEYGERVAARFLTDQGMTILDANWRCDLGEIDLVLQDGSALVICEVKTRSTAVGGHPLEGVDEAKADRMYHLALRWMEAHDAHPTDLRLDVVGITVTGHGAAYVEHARWE